MDKDNSQNTGLRVLIVDDDEANLATLEAYVAIQGYSPIRAQGGEEALRKVEALSPDIILLDLLMPGMDGFELTRRLKSNPATFKIPVVAVTALHDRKSNLKAIEAGVDQFLTKPIDEVMLKAHLSNQLKIRQLSLDLDSSRNRLEMLGEYHRRISPGRCATREIIGESQPIKNVLAKIHMIKDLDAPVLILGESGSGKQLAAEAIHWEGVRACEPFVHINCANLQENLLESELFGHSKGSFTGALSQKKGLIEVAEKGTLFVDEIGDMSPSVQAKMLVVLDSGMFRRLGDTKERRADARVVAATNKDIEGMIKQGLFRADLLYRIGVLTIELPPLRERKEDIPPLARYFLDHSRFVSDGPKELSSKAMERLIEYDWPGNVRELSNVIERAVVFSGSQERISLRHLPPHILAFSRKSNGSSPIADARETSAPATSGRTLAEVELAHIREVLRSEKGNRTRAAEILGISRSTLKKKIAQHPLLLKTSA